MEKKEGTRGKKPSSSRDFSGEGRNWEEKRIASPSEMFERLNQTAMGRPDPNKELTGSEFLEFLTKQGPEGSRSSRAASGQGSANKNQNVQRERSHQSGAIDQCDITSSVDYGSRDYYSPSAHASDAPYIPKDNETTTDTRGNWWQGSLYY